MLAHTRARDGAGAGRAAATEKLLLAGACLEVRDADFRTPLLAAVDMGQAKVVEVLLAKGASTDALDECATGGAI